MSVGAVLCAVRLLKVWRGEVDDLAPEEIS